MPTDTIRLDVDDTVATITLDDPERKNALTRGTYLELIDALDAAERSDARCLVLEGAGEAFSSGGDVESMGEDLDRGDRPDVEEEVDVIQTHEHAAIERLVEFPLPTVAKADGVALADGASLAIGCDVTLASERTRIGVTHVWFGLSLDVGASYLLPRAVGEKVAKELAFTGEIVDADRALELGLVNHVYPVGEFEERADGLIAGIADGPPLALRHVKRLVSEGADRPVDECLREEALAQAIMFGTDDYEEGVAAFLDGRDPEFSGT